MVELNKSDAIDYKNIENKLEGYHRYVKIGDTSDLENLFEFKKRLRYNGITMNLITLSKILYIICITLLMFIPIYLIDFESYTSIASMMFLSIIISLCSTALLRLIKYANIEKIGIKIKRNANLTSAQSFLPEQIKQRIIEIKTSYGDDIIKEMNIAFLTETSFLQKLFGFHNLLYIKLKNDSMFVIGTWTNKDKSLDTKVNVSKIKNLEVN